jgi:hypothetical protein
VGYEDHQRRQRPAGHLARSDHLQWSDEHDDDAAPDHHDPTPHDDHPPADHDQPPAADHEWPGGFQGDVRVTSNGTTATTSWSVVVTFPNNQRITQVWGGRTAQTASPHTVTNETWNGGIAAGQGQITWQDRDNFTRVVPSDAPETPTSWKLSRSWRAGVGQRGTSRHAGSNAGTAAVFSDFQLTWPNSVRRW